MDSRTPDALSTQAENELICEKLLRWKRCPSCGEQKWYSNYDRRDPTSGPFQTCVTPSFTTWADAGLILDALQRMNVIGIAANLKYDAVIENLCIDLQRRELMPLKVRAAALEYIRSLP